MMASSLAGAGCSVIVITVSGDDNKGMKGWVKAATASLAASLTSCKTQDTRVLTRGYPMDLL